MPSIAAGHGHSAVRGGPSRLPWLCCSLLLAFTAAPAAHSVTEYEELAASEAVAEEGPSQGADAAGQGADGAEPHKKARGKIEEMKVTGRRREELLQEIPISIRAFDAQELSDRNIVRIDEIGFATANLQFDAANGSARDARIYIRGIGQDDTRSIVDPGVGMYIDNVYIPRATNALFDVVDFERVEVLRGPQGTLYGKNTVGGVINIITQKPGQEFGGYVDVNVGRFGLLETRAAIDAPVRLGWFDDKLFTRWLVATSTDDGYTRNLADGGRSGDNKLLAGRFAARLFATRDLTFDLVFDWQRQNEKAVIGKCALGNPYNIARYVTDNFSGDGPGDRFRDWCARTSMLGPHVGYAIPLLKRNTDTYGTSMQIDYHVPTGGSWEMAVKSITGFRYRDENATAGDGDGTPLSYIGSGPAENTHWSVSEDLNLNFNFWDDRIDLIVGGYFFKEEGHEVTEGNVLRDMALGQDPEFSGDPTTIPATPAETYPNKRAVLDAIFPGFPAGLKDGLNVLFLTDEYWRNTLMWGLGELNRRRTMDWNNVSWAGYSHMDFKVVDEVTLQGGVRYTRESKTRGGVDQRLFCSDLITKLTLPLDIRTIPPEACPNSNPASTFMNSNPTAAPIFTQSYPNGLDPNYSEAKDRFTPEAGIKWQINDDHMTYFRYAQGWKSGGLKVEALLEDRFGDPAFAFYDPETVDSFEVGAKTQWFDNQLFLNLTFFWNDFKNMQVSALVPDERGIVTNAPSNADAAVTRGFEFEGAWAPDFEWLPGPNANMFFTTGVGFTDAYYKEYFIQKQPPILAIDSSVCPTLNRAECMDVGNPAGWTVDHFVLLTMAQTAQLVAPAPFQRVDVSNRHFKNTPRLNLNASFNYELDVMKDVTLGARLDYYYRSTIYYTVENNPNLVAPPLNNLNASLNLHITATDTRLSLWVKNLTDAVYKVGGISTGESLGADAVFYSKPRTYGLQVQQPF